VRATTITSWALLIHRGLAECGQDPDALFKKAGLDPAALADANARYPFDGMQRLWRLAVEATGDSDFGLVAARCWHPTSWHALGYAWLASPSLRDAFERSARYSRMVSDAFVFELKPSDAGAWFSAQMRAPLPSPRRASQDAAVSTIVRMCRLSRGEQFRPLRVRFAYEKPDRLNALSELLQAPMEFCCDLCGIEVAAADLDAELPTANAELARANERVVLEYLARFDTKSIGLKVRTKLLEQLASGHASEASIARALNMTERTLQRRLRDEGTSYNMLLDEVRRELAAQYVAEAELSFSEITYLLGFSEPSNFSRAFKRWTGKSPSAYRAAAPSSNGAQWTHHR
jgi:AraC-like DNA-binding protein